MIRNIIARFAHCTIFWAHDFINWKTVSDTLYPSEISKMSNYVIFRVQALSDISFAITSQWTKKYVNNNKNNTKLKKLKSTF